jgi:hypothetical protein
MSPSAVSTLPEPASFRQPHGYAQGETAGNSSPPARSAARTDTPDAAVR